MEQELNPYPEYKSVNLNWILQIPEHWNCERAKNMFDKLNRAVEDTDETITCFRDGVVTLRKNRRITGFTESLKEIGYQGIRKGDLVIHQMDAFAGSVGVSDSNGKSTPVYSVCVPKNDKYNNYYYAHLIREMGKNGFIQSLYRGIRERSSDFRFDTFAKLFLPIPPRPEQDQIVKFLDFKISKLNKFIKDKKREIELLKELKQAEINRAVTKGLNPNVPMKDSGIDWLGEIPEHWEVRRLKSFSDFVNRGSTPLYTEDILYKVVNQATFSKGFWDLKNIRYTSASIENNRGLLLKEDILLASTGGGVLGKCYLFKEEGIYIADSHVSIIRDSKSRFHPEYIYYFLSINYHLINGILAQGSTNQIELQREWLRSMFFPYPDIKEQLEIATFIVGLEDKINNLIESIESEIIKIQEYKISLISDVVTGKVDVRDVSIEDAFEMETLDEVETEEIVEE